MLSWTIAQIKLAQNDPLGSLEPSETPSGSSPPPQLQLGSRRTGGVLMGFLEILAGVTKIKVAQYDPSGSLEPSAYKKGRKNFRTSHHVFKQGPYILVNVYLFYQQQGTGVQTHTSLLLGAITQHIYYIFKSGREFKK